MNSKFLSNEQVHELNEKHGWFHYGDAQSDVSRAFAQDAIALHEAMRAAAPAMHAALVAITSLSVDNSTTAWNAALNQCADALKQAKPED